MSRFPGIVTKGSHRPVCPRCLKNPAVCICAEVRPISTGPQLLILQHPMEIYRPSATARLVALAIPATRLFVKDDPSDEASLQALLAAPGPRPYLLTPDPSAPEAGELRESGVWLKGPPPVFLLLDGSWRQVRRMRSRRRYLDGLPVVTLRPQTSSVYRIRRQANPGHLSTLEAAALLLSRVEGNFEKYVPLLELLDVMVTRILRLRGLDREGKPIPKNSRQPGEIAAG